MDSIGNFVYGIMGKKPEFRFSQRIRSFKFAAKGMKRLLQHEHNARLHLLASVVAVVLSLLFSISAGEWLAIVIAIGAVFTAELLNTAIERLADVVEPRRQEKIGWIKDYAAAAVLTASIMAVVIALIIFLPRIIACIQ